MILVDYLGIAIGNIITQKLEIQEDLIRHMILNTIRMYRKKFSKTHGEIILCVDSGGNWRKEIYPEYKASRKTGRDESDLDWDKIFEIVNKVREEIYENFPYKVLQVYGTEADDVISTLCEYTQEFGNFDNIMIVSADKDFAQLQRFDNVKQFSTITKKFIIEKDPHGFLQEHIFKGDGSDGVPNVLSPDDCFVKGIRQNRLTKVKKDSWRNAENLQETMGDDVYRNYLRNKKMIDLRETPEDLKQKIINTYEEQNQEPNRKKVMNFLIKKRCKLLLGSLGDFIE